MLARYTIITIFSLFLFLGADAQSKKSKNILNGQWSGIVTQEKDGGSTIYKFEVYIAQDGKKITGRSYVEYEDIYAIMDFEGSIKAGKMVFLEETNIVDYKKTKDVEWCMKKCQLMLKYDGEQLVLEGFWQGSSVIGACIPGKVKLTMEEPRA